MGDHTLFVYGTLMAPEMLYRVIHGRPNPEPWQAAQVGFRPAVLHGFRRHRVRGADYPGIIPAPATTTSSSTTSTTSTTTGTAATTSSTNSADNKPTSVLGTLVTGLTDSNMQMLDIYEGDEYVREQVMVRTLQETLQIHPHTAHTSGSTSLTTANGHIRDVLDAAGAEFADEAEEVSALTYVWVAGHESLEEAEWDFDMFKRDKMAWWVAKDESEW